MKVENKDINLLKSIADTLINELDNGFIFFINEKEDGSVNFIAKSNSKVNSGFVVKTISNLYNGNGGGSPTFAQGGAKSIDSNIISEVEKAINNG